jgi:hypothetical protein
MQSHLRCLPLYLSLNAQQDQDSWAGGTGSGDQCPQVFSLKLLLSEPESVPVKCRRSCLHCKGCYACSLLDPKLLEVERFELDPKSRDAIIEAETESRLDEGSTANRTAATQVLRILSEVHFNLIFRFYQVVQMKPCNAKQGDGVCTGRPVMIQFNGVNPGLLHAVSNVDLPYLLQASRQGKYHFIGCTGWLPTFRKSHRSTTIPDHVNEDLLAMLFKGEPLPGASAGKKCSRVISSHIGRKLKTCGNSFIVKLSCQ